jgi:RNA polymerase sigma factor (sigma-70 family)
VLDWLLRNGRREEICTSVARRTGAPRDLVEDALQDVCRIATTKCRGETRGEVYNWLLKATLRRVAKLRSRSHHRHELLVDLSSDEPKLTAASDGADVEVLERERERELAAVANSVVAKLNERQRRVAALHSRQVAGREIAQHLGTSERRVKRLKEETFARARHALVEAAGGGCDQGERLISRFSFGLASPRERTEAQLHLAGCERCGTLYQRLEHVHEKVAALLPIPAAASADTSLVERTLQKTSEVLAQAKQQVADASTHAKQQAAAGYTRAMEYTPLAGARPGAAATAIAGCLALGGGAAGYCIDRGVDPVTGFVDILRPAPTDPPPEPQDEPVAKQLPTQTPLATTPAPVPAEPQPVIQPERQATPPPPPPEPTPAGVQFGEPATASQAAASTPTESHQPARPAAVPQNGGTDLYGP